MEHTVIDCYAEQKYYALKYFALDSTCTHLIFFKDRTNVIQEFSTGFTFEPFIDFA